jgi:putative NADPH-quinone reductase
MTAKNILLIQGHPDGSAIHLGHHLEEAYAQGAESAGHAVRRLSVAQLDFPLLRSQNDWQSGTLPQGLVQAQKDIAWAEHIVFFFPLWLGDMPALLKGFLEQVARPDFAFKRDGKDPLQHKALTGKSARVVVTMGMPALLYRWYFRAHSVKSLERNILGFVGISPVHKTLIGLVDALGEAGVQKWQVNLTRLGVQAS